MGPPDIWGCTRRLFVLPGNKHAPAKSYCTIHPFIIYFFKNVIKKGSNLKRNCELNPIQTHRKHAEIIFDLIPCSSTRQQRLQQCKVHYY